MPETSSIAGTAHAARQRRRAHARRRRLLSLGLLVAAAFLAGALVGADRGSADKALAVSFMRAWTHGDYARMYADIDLPARRVISPTSFASDYRADATTATTTALAVGSSALREERGGVVLPVRVRTYLFGTLRANVRVPVRSERGRLRVVWSTSLLFPGLRPGERLTRRTWLPPRATLLARDGSVLAEGSAPPAVGEGERSSPLGAAASGVVGTVGPIPAAERVQLEPRGVPSDATVGTSGLERSFDARLRGRPGGELLAGGRLIATASAAPAPPLRTSISPAVQRAAALALGDQLGGVVALLPARGEVLGVAGLGIDDVQPPGSTFKLITLPAALEAGLASPSTTFPYETAATLGGVELRNAGGESCGGTLAEAFAVSCNSVFAPLGAKLGSPRLVATAERLGFNHPPGLAGAAESTLPPASRIQGELDTGSTAIGQGEVLASPLQMALVAAAIANGGRRTVPRFLPYSQASRQGAIAPGEAQVISPTVAHTETRLMEGVVRYGTGTAAAIPGVEVAGKTGTAELGGGSCGAGSSPEAATATAGEGCAASEHQNTDAWFAAFAPARQPRIVLAVMLVHAGYGGETAAPVARQVIEAALAAGSH